MDLNNINLPSSLLTDFYKNHLIESSIESGVTKNEATTVSMAAAQTKTGIQYLGKNQKGICIIVSYAKDVYLPDEQLNFLTTILQACQLNLGDVAIINNYRSKLSFEDIRKQITCNHLLIFGVNTRDIGLEEIPLFAIQNISDCNIVYSMAAEQLNSKDAESKILKSKLWGCLKKMFNV